MTGKQSKRPALSENKLPHTIAAIAADKARLRPVIWPLVQIAGNHIAQSDAQGRPDEGTEVAMRIMDALPSAVPSDACEVGGLLLALRSRVDDLACIVYEGAPRPGVSDGRTDRAARIAGDLEYALVRAAAVLWQGEGWDAASESVFGLVSTEQERRRINADLRSVGLGGIPAGLLPASDGEDCSAPDARLLSLCDQFFAHAKEETEAATDEQGDAANERRNAAKAAVVALPARSSAGLAAKARVIVEDGAGGIYPQELLKSLVADAYAVAGVALPDPFMPWTDAAVESEAVRHG